MSRKYVVYLSFLWSRARIFWNIKTLKCTSLNTRNIKGTPLTPVPTVPTLPTISEVKVQEHSSSGATSNSGSMDLKNISNKSKSKKNIDETKDTKDAEKPENEFNKTVIPRNASQPAFTTHVQGLPKNGSVPFFDRIRKTSTSYKPSLSAIKNSRTTLNSNGDIRKSLHLRLSTNSILGNNNAEGDVSTYLPIWTFLLCNILILLYYTSSTNLIACVFRFVIIW